MCKHKHKLPGKFSTDAESLLTVTVIAKPKSVHTKKKKKYSYTSAHKSHSTLIYLITYHTETPVGK